jgi:hypothetical protein
MDTSVLERNSTIAALRARRQKNALHRSMRCSVLLAGLLLCMQMSCSGGGTPAKALRQHLSYPA